MRIDRIVSLPCVAFVLQNRPEARLSGVTLAARYYSLKP
jgi:hypothetical protein